MTWTAPRTWITGETVDSTEMNQHIRDNLHAILPLGTYIYRVGVATAIETVIENRFVECNGAAISRTTYDDLAALFASFTPAYPFGSGDGTTTFNVPDLRGRMPVGMGTHADVNTLGDNEGVGDIAYRRPKHATQVQTEDAGTGDNARMPYGTNTLGVTTRYIKVDGLVTQSSPTDQPIDAPAYLVAGVWYIKYTS